MKIILAILRQIFDALFARILTMKKTKKEFRHVGKEADNPDDVFDSSDW